MCATNLGANRRRMPGGLMTKVNPVLETQILSARLPAYVIASSDLQRCQNPPGARSAGGSLTWRHRLAFYEGEASSTPVTIRFPDDRALSHDDRVHRLRIGFDRSQPLAASSTSP